MKMKKTMGIILAVMMVSAIFLTGAAAASEGEKGVDEIIKNMDAAMADVTNFNGNMDMTLDMSTMGQDMSIGAVSELSMFLEPLRMKMDMTMNISVSGEDGGDMTMPMEMYYEDGVVYTGMAGMWSQQDLSEVDAGIDQYNVQQNYSDFTGELTDMTLVGTDNTVMGQEVYVIESVVDADAVKSVLDNSGMMQNVGLDDSSAEFQSILDSMEQASVIFYVYTDSFLFAGYEMDMSGIMDSVLSTVMQGSEETEGSAIEVSECYVSFFYSDYNEATDFEVPAEALEAEAA